MLFILCGAGGMRIGEVLGVEIDKHLSLDFMTISVTQKVRRCKVEDRLKTARAFRMVDLHPEIAYLLAELVGEGKTGFLFCTRNGMPLATSNRCALTINFVFRRPTTRLPVSGTGAKSSKLCAASWSVRLAPRLPPES
jgi:hypothetical protein